MCPSTAIKSTLYLCDRLQERIPVRHNLLGASPTLLPIHVDLNGYGKNIFGKKLEPSENAIVNLARNQYHYVLAYHSLTKTARSDSWNRINLEWKRRNKTHTPAEISELLSGINSFVGLLMRPVVVYAVPYNPERFKEFLLDGRVPEEELIKILNPPGASPRYSVRMNNFFIDYEHVLDLYRDEWQKTVENAPVDAMQTQQFQTMTHALSSLINVYDAYFQVF